MSNYRFALGPRWIVLHILIVIFVPLFILAGFWQLHRLHERRARNDTIRHSKVEVTGHYDASREVIVRNRSLAEQAGNHVVTPLVTNGRAVLVDRGWVPAAVDRPRASDTAPPTGRVTVTGLKLQAEPKRPLAPDDPRRGHLDVVSRIDPSRLQVQMPYRLDDQYVLLSAQRPAQPGKLPVIAPGPILDDGPHLSYAVQWFLFVPTLLVVYVALLRRTARVGSRSPDRA